MLIVIEGADACGKDTVAAAVAKQLGCETLNFPNDDGVTGPMIRGYLSKQWRVVVEGEGDDRYQEPSAMAFQALQVTNRMEVMPRLWATVGHPDKHLVLVRYWQSGFVYGTLDGLKTDWLLNIHSAMAQGDLNILLDIDADTAIDRLVGRGGELERYEGRRDTTTTICALYHQLWATKQKIEGGWAIVDAKHPVEDVISSTMRAVSSLGGLVAR